MAKKINFKTCGLLLVISITHHGLVFAETSRPEKPVYGDYKDWRILGVSHRLDKNYIRSIVGNNLAVNAGRAGKVQPWPDGVVIAKLSWKASISSDWPQAVIPGEFVGAEAMVKDSKKYSETGGWGFGRWEGQSLVMNDSQQTAVCLGCHVMMKDHDYVFTKPVFQ
jgi:hypothetical protein